MDEYYDEKEWEGYDYDEYDYSDEEEPGGIYTADDWYDEDYTEEVKKDTTPKKVEPSKKSEIKLITQTESIAKDTGNNYIQTLGNHTTRNLFKFLDPLSYGMLCLTCKKFFAYANDNSILLPLLPI